MRVARPRAEHRRLRHLGGKMASHDLGFNLDGVQELDDVSDETVLDPQDHCIVRLIIG